MKKIITIVISLIAVLTVFSASFLAIDERKTVTGITESAERVITP